MDLPGDQAQQGDREALASCVAGIRVLEFGAEERGEVGTGLGDDEVVDVEELGDAGEWGITVGVAGVAPGAESDFLGVGPGDDGAGFVFAFEDDGGVHCCRGGVGG